ncbi:hypothetical protein [Arthrobacter sp. MYb213]|uniref:hypothetical protein n=1 Tax=Arthrobacter sp. MYb213 TaxID=1848595 RepID=UPI000CFB0F81|nr:hypothetical protein [Arthrobacter sp. MYb213]PRB70470.1 hypothetical protein CQ011_10030 [Arthrobacter sp. MYb213]
MSRRAMQVKALLAMGILVGFGSVSTLAAWTGTATATSSIESATVALGVGATDGTATLKSYPMVITGNNLYPGSSVASTVTVKNTGSISAPYTISGTITEDVSGTLGKGMTISVRANATVAGTGSKVTCSGGSEVIAKNAGSQFSGTSSPRTLPAGSSEALCIQYSLPTSAANTLQKSSATLALNFTSTVGS